MIAWLLLLALVWIGVGLALFWWGTRTPAPGSRRLVRTCGRRFAFVHQEVPVDLWPAAKGLPRPKRPPREQRVLMVLDHSGSMGRGPGSSLEHAKRAAVSFARSTASEHCRLGVVSFSHEAKTVLGVDASSARQVSHAINSIGPGGGTDIALALRQAGQALVESPAPAGAERVVVLLSDGGSDPVPARCAAAELHGAGVRVIAVGLGSYVNEELLRAIATREEDYFHTLEAAELTRLYDAIAAELEQACGFAAHVEERVSREPFVVSSLGDLLPTRADFNSRELTWYVPSVRESGEDNIPYQVIALRWGWHRIAERKATVTMQDADGRGYTGESNASPYLLVIPRLVWPMWLVLLNPLFWLLRDVLLGLLGRRPEALTIPPEPRPTPVRLPAANAVAARPRRVGRTAVRPALLVGVGGTGGRVLEAVCDHLDLLAPAGAADLRMLWVDTGPDPTPGGSPRVGDGLPDGDRLLLASDDLQPFVDQVWRQQSRPDQLAWIEAVMGELRTLRPRDFDLKHGTHHRRALARVAFYRHLEAAGPPLLAELDRRLEDLVGLACDRGYQVLVVANPAGGTGGGVLVDLLALIQKRLPPPPHSGPRAVDLLLVSHLAFEQHDETAARNARACLAELGRLAVRPQLPIVLLQRPGETREEATVAKLLDSVLLLERLPEAHACLGDQAARVHHAAARTLLDQLFTGDEQEAAEMLDRHAVSRAGARSGQAMIFGAGSSARWFPAAQVERLVTAQATFELVAEDLIALERRGDHLVPTTGIEETAADEVARLLAGGGLRRRRPSFVGSYEALAERESTGLELGKILEDLDTYPGTQRVSSKMAGERLQAAILDNEQQAMGSLLEEWALAILNGTPAEGGDFDLAARRGGISRLAAASRRLGALSAATLASIEAGEASARQRGMADRYRFVLALFSRYHEAIRGLERAAQGWFNALAQQSDGEEGQGAGSVVCRAEAAAAVVRDELARMSRSLAPEVVWSTEMEERLLREVVERKRTELLAQVAWGTEQPGKPHRLTLRVAAATGHDFVDPAGDVKKILEQLESLAADVVLAALPAPVVTAGLDVGAWLTAARAEPVDVDSVEQARLAEDAARPREIARIPAGIEPSAHGGAIVPLDLRPWPEQFAAQLLRLTFPCALEATATAREALLQGDDRPHRELPFLDPVDRRVAEIEDLFPELGLSRPFFGAVTRGYFHDRELLLALALGAALGLVAQRLGSAEPVLAMGELELSDEDAVGVGHPMLWDGLDRILVNGTGPNGEPFDRRRALELVEATVAERSTEDLAEAERRLEECLEPILVSCPAGFKRDFVDLARFSLAREQAKRRVG